MNAKEIALFKLIKELNIKDLQKAVFLLKHLKIHPFTKYKFNLLVRGPYSLDLANDYYNLEEVKEDLKLASLMF